MKRFFRSEVGAAMVWVAATLTLAALLAPWLYRSGNWLAAHAQAHELAPVWEWLGAACGRANFGRFFDRSLLISALVLLPWLLRRVRALTATNPTAPRRHLPWPAALTHLVLGCLLAGGLLWATGTGLATAGAYAVRAHPPVPGQVLAKVLGPAIAAASIEEWLFRGLLLGLWLRCARPATAAVGTSLLFAFLHFLKPPEGVLIADPAGPLAGVELLGKIMLHFTDPLFFITDFASLLAVGLILAWSRLRTGALWFAIGLHAGWIMTFKAFNMVYRSMPHDLLRPWLIGDSLRSGLIPLLTLGLTAGLCRLLWKQLDKTGPRI